MERGFNNYYSIIQGICYEVYRNALHPPQPGGIPDLCRRAAGTNPLRCHSGGTDRRLSGLRGKKKDISTLCSLAYVRHTIDTKDSFYEKESDYIDEISPVLQEIDQKINLSLLNSLFRSRLEEKFGSLLFQNLEISVRCMKPEIMELMQEENKLTSEYQKLYASATVEWEGETLPLPKLGPFLQSPDRPVRKAAFQVRVNGSRITGSSWTSSMTSW